jgi:Na+/H+ antiporter NhaD/arsenite permease-like protein
MRPLRSLAPAALTLLFAGTAVAADAHGLDGAKLMPPWGIPFIGILLSIAVLPLAAPAFWHRHYGKVAAFWALALVLPLAALQGASATAGAVLHTVLLEYLPFIILLFALYTVAGGILVSGDLNGTPVTNTAILALGAAIASVVGTTGASMILIRPILRANEGRRFNVHVVVFFIFLVANIGGALSPLGDPPLFIGFLRGVDFFWTTKHLAWPTALACVILLAVFFALDSWLFARERGGTKPRAKTSKPIRIHGRINFVLLAGVIAAILLAVAWKPGVTMTLYGVPLEGQNLASNAALLGLAALSLWLTREEHRAANGFSWEPINEVAKLFAGIFVTIIPVLAMLAAGRAGPFGWMLALVTEKDGTPYEIAYFWLSGVLSAFLDNAPTYLVFFELAGGDARELMGALAPTLAAISMGAVFMGALTYIGNAPNFMVKAIAEERGVKMPSFFGFIGWSALFLLPIFLLLSWIKAWEL